MEQERRKNRTAPCQSQYPGWEAFPILLEISNIRMQAQKEKIIILELEIERLRDRREAAEALWPIAVPGCPVQSYDLAHDHLFLTLPFQMTRRRVIASWLGGLVSCQLNGNRSATRLARRLTRVRKARKEAVG